MPRSKAYDLRSQYSDIDFSVDLATFSPNQSDRNLVALISHLLLLTKSKRDKRRYRVNRRAISKVSYEGNDIEMGMALIDTRCNTLCMYLEQQKAPPKLLMWLFIMVAFR